MSHLAHTSAQYVTDSQLNLSSDYRAQVEYRKFFVPMCTCIHIQPSSTERSVFNQVATFTSTQFIGDTMQQLGTLSGDFE